MPPKAREFIVTFEPVTKEQAAAMVAQAVPAIARLLQSYEAQQQKGGKESETRAA